VAGKYGGAYAGVSMDGTLTSVGGSIFVIGGEGADDVAVSIDGTITTDAELFFVGEEPVTLRAVCR
jgi:hypothetical protein